MNNNLLKKAQEWLNDLTISTDMENNVLKVSKSDVQSVLSMAKDELLNEIKTALESKKFYWDKEDNQYFYLTTF